jgi:hypothetical protein
MAVIGASPVTIISEDTKTPNAGLQYQIPLSLISIDDKGEADLSQWPLYSKLQSDTSEDEKLIANYVNSLISRGLLKKSPSP